MTTTVMHFFKGFQFAVHTNWKLVICPVTVMAENGVTCCADYLAQRGGMTSFGGFENPITDIHRRPEPLYQGPALLTDQTGEIKSNQTITHFGLI